jgi:surface polysaccharide O-acyltransferase-like enzyme
MQRNHYLDNIRVVLTALVILHHAFVCYGAPGGWYYKEPVDSGSLASVLMTFFVSINQSFFMGFFFLLSAYFTASSLERKGRKQFLLDRFKRLGIPLLFYSFILSPCMNFLVYRYGQDKTATFLQYLQGYDDWIDFGVLWFVVALLLFTIVYVFIDYKTKPMSSTRTGRIILLTVIAGLISFVVRLVFPVGWVLKPVGFQLGHFTQYIILFAVGIIARRNNWGDQLPYKTFGWLALLMIVIMLPLLFYVHRLLGGPMSDFVGGLTVESFAYSLWEQITGFAIIVFLAGWFKQHWNGASSLSRSAFAVYIFHPLVLIIAALLVRHWPVDPVYKLLVIAAPSVICTFILGTLLVKIPVVNRII